jgi:hypothetical protein
MFDVKVNGLENIANGFNKFARMMKQQEAAAVKGAALLFQNQWVKNVQLGVFKAPRATKRRRKDGTWYKTYKGRRLSTGTYARSIHTKLISTYPYAIARVGSDLVNPPYPFFLEYGTIYIKERLWASDAWESQYYAMQEEMKRLIENIKVF